MTLATYLSSIFGDWEALLGWTSESYQIIVSETLDALGLEVEPDPLTLAVKAVGKRELWKRAWSQTAGEVNTNADGVSVSKSQAHEQLGHVYQDAITDASIYTDDIQVVVKKYHLGGTHYDSEFNRVC